MLADREGRLEDRPKRIKGELLPFDSQDVDPLLNELAAHGFLVRYRNSDGSFIQISKFSAHQSPHYSEKKSVIKPPILPESVVDDVAETPGALPEHSRKEVAIKRGSQPPDSLIPDSLIPESPILKKTKTPRAKLTLHALPENWTPSDRTVERLASQFRFSNGDAERYAAAFRDACAAKGYRYADFDAAFSNCVRQDWPKFRSGSPTMPAHISERKVAL